MSCNLPSMTVAIPRRARLSAVLFSAALLAMPSATLAQQWFYTPLVEVGAQYIDNPRLVEETGQTDDIAGGLLDLGVELVRNTQTSSVLLRPSAEIYRYGSDSNEDSEAYFLDFDAEKRGQRSEWRLRSNYRQQQVLRGETTSSDVEDIGVDDAVVGTGQTFERRQRDMFRVRPGVTFNFTERTGLAFDVNYVNVGYENQELGEAVDFTNLRGDVGIVRALSPDSSLTFGVFAEQYDPDSPTRRDSESTGARVLYEKEVTDVSNFSIEVGAQESDVQSPADPLTDISETTFLWNIGYGRRWERTRWSFDVGQQVSPSGAGFLVERDLYRAIMQHQLRPRWSLQFSAVFMNTDAVGGEDVNAIIDRDWFESRISLGYQVTRTWTVQGMYRLTHQDFADIPGDAREHEVRLSLVYRRPLPTT